MKYFNTKAIALDEQFKRLRDELTAFAETPLGRKQINAVDETAVRKLLNHPGDITPSRLVSISTKLVNRFYNKS